jgi:hypothetical protein
VSRCAPTSPPWRLAGRLSGAVASAWLALAFPVSAQEGSVRISCAEVRTERVAEVESRVRANLLTSDSPATVVIACGSDHVEVQATAGERTAGARLATTEETWRDDVLRAVDQALQDLTAIDSTADLEPAPAPVEEPSTAIAPVPRPYTPPVVVTPARAAPARSPAPATRLGIEPAATFRSELWRDRLALGGLLGVVLRTRPLFCSLRAGVLRPVSQDSRFEIDEFSWSVGVSYQPSFGAGLRASLNAGASLLLVTPSGQLISRTGTTSAAPFFDAELSRPFSFGQFAVVPALGLRWFSSERGVRLDTKERFLLRGVAPHLGVGLAYLVK